MSIRVNHFFFFTPSFLCLKLISHLLLFVTLLSHHFFGPAIDCLLLFFSVSQNILDKSSKISCYKILSMNFVLVFSEVRILVNDKILAFFYKLRKSRSNKLCFSVATCSRFQVPDYTIGTCLESIDSCIVKFSNII
jgi:hypothetical protein